MSRENGSVSAREMFPDGIAWLTLDPQIHPEAGRVKRIAFFFAIGPVRGADGHRHTIRESDLVTTALSTDVSPAVARERVSKYATFVCRTAAGNDARLRGRTLAAYIAQEGSR